MTDVEALSGAEIRKRLRALSPPGLAETAWAEAAGLNRGFFTNLESVQSPRLASVRALLAFIGKTEADLSNPSPASNAQAVQFEGASLEEVRDDLPVYGTALGAERIVEGDAVEQTYLNTGEIIEYRKRPPIVRGVEKVYGLYVQGMSMYPAHRDGAFMFVQRDAALRRGDDVVVYLRMNGDFDDGESASKVLVKRLVSRTARALTLEQFTPVLTFEIPMSDVLRIDRVLTADDYA